VSIAVEHTITLLDHGLSDGLRQVTLAAAGWTEKQGVLVGGDEGAAGQVEDQAAIHLGIEAEVEVVQALLKACMQLQRWSGLSLVDAVCLSKDELLQDRNVFRVRTKRRKTGAHINNVIPSPLAKELLRVKNGNPTYFFISGEATTKGAVSTIDKMYRQVFEKAGIDGTSHMFRHTFAVELLKAGVDIRKVSRALGHSSVVITERYYAKWNKAQQDILDGDLARAWKS